MPTNETTPVLKYLSHPTEPTPTPPELTIWMDEMGFIRCRTPEGTWVIAYVRLGSMNNALVLALMPGIVDKYILTDSDGYIQTYPKRKEF